MSGEPYMVEIERDHVEDFANRVANEEAGASRFIDNKIAAFDGRTTNLAVFETLAAGELPDLPVFVPVDEVPDDTEPEWTGSILIDGSAVMVSMYREELDE